MDVELDHHAQEFVNEQVRTGKFRSPAEVLGEAVHRMMAETELALDPETVAAIGRADAQIDRGEGIEFEQFAADWRKKLQAG
jgi:Arc/MetJ-type ribon-helix-helix transcriptional regulator